MAVGVVQNLGQKRGFGFRVYWSHLSYMIQIAAIPHCACIAIFSGQFLALIEKSAEQSHTHTHTHTHTQDDYRMPRGSAHQGITTLVYHTDVLEFMCFECDVTQPGIQAFTVRGGVTVERTPAFSHLRMRKGNNLHCSIYYVKEAAKETLLRVSTLLSCKLACQWETRQTSIASYVLCACLRFINIHNIVTYLLRCLGTLAKFSH